LAVAVIATLVQSRTSFHYALLAERVTASSPLGHLIPTLQGLFVQQGASLSAAYGAAIQEIEGMLRVQATDLAMQDAFLISFGLTICAIIATIFVRSRKIAIVGNSTPSETERHEAAAARDEASVSI